MLLAAVAGRSSAARRVNPPLRAPSGHARGSDMAAALAA